MTVMTVQEFAAEMGIPPRDTVRIIRCTCDSNGEPVSVATLFDGFAGNISAPVSSLPVERCNSDFWSRDGAWKLEIPEVYL